MPVVAGEKCCQEDVILVMAALCPTLLAMIVSRICLLVSIGVSEAFSTLQQCLAYTSSSVRNKEPG